MAIAKHTALSLISGECLKPDAPIIDIGDTVRVHVRIVGESTAKVKDAKASKNARAGSKADENEKKSRIQVFEGTVIAKQHGGIEETYTVRRLSHGVGVERVFPRHSPVIEKVEVVRHGKVRRAKLYYLRGRVGKAAKVQVKVQSKVG